MGGAPYLLMEDTMGCGPLVERTGWMQNRLSTTLFANFNAVCMLLYTSMFCGVSLLAYFT